MCSVSEFDWVDCERVKRTGGVWLSVLHLVLFFDETGSLLVVKLRIRPAAIRVTSLSAKSGFRLEWVVCELGWDLVCEFGSIDSLEMVFFSRLLRGFLGSCLGCIEWFASSHGAPTCRAITLRAVHWFSSNSLFGDASWFRYLTFWSLSLFTR